jgi:protein gp37
MGLHTPIEWCDSTVNPTENCDGCELWDPAKKVKICYAGRQTERYRGLGAFDEPIKLFPGRMAQAAKWSDLRGQARPDKPWIPKELPRLIFISDMSDALSEDVKFDFLHTEIIRTVSTLPGSRHVWIWLTKRPRRMALFSRWLDQHVGPWPKNLWALTSVTDERTASTRIPFILQVGDENTVHGISAEPLLQTIFPRFFRCTHCGQINDFDHVSELTRPDPTCGHCDGDHSCRYALDWVVVGGQSGSMAPIGTEQRIAWLAKQSSWARSAVFVKQMGRIADLKDPKGGDWNEWEPSLRVRQFPKPTL